MATLSTVLIGAYTGLGQLLVRSATGGSNTTIVDSALGGNDDDWNNGFAVIIRDSAGASAAPEGEFKVITDYTASSGTITVAAFSGSSAPASGDTYGISSPEFPTYQMVQAVNEALRSMGPMPLVDTTSLDTAAQQTEYTYALAWKRNPPRSVWIQGKTGDANDNKWKEIKGWHYIPAAAGSTGLLVFDKQWLISRDIRVIYDGIHPVVNAYSDKINELIDEELIIAETIYQALLWANGRDGYTDRGRIGQLNQAAANRDLARARAPIWKPKRRRKVLSVHWDEDADVDQFDYPDPA